MKLWLLRPIIKDKDKNPFVKGASPHPWEPWYDKVFGFVIRAETENIARVIAGVNAKHEADETNPWLEVGYSSCVELTLEGNEELIIVDFRGS